MGKKIFNILVIAFLVFLFLFPGMYLATLAEEVENFAEQAMDAAHMGQWEQVRDDLEAMNALFQPYKQHLQLFLSHRDVLELEISLRACLQLARVEDDAQFLMEMEHVVMQARYLISIERFNIHTLF